MIIGDNIRKLTFAIDFDDTLTVAPDLWRNVIRTMREAGHMVYIVTCRRDTPENRLIIREFLTKHGISDETAQFSGISGVVLSNMGPKTLAVAQRGIKVDIWIDDMPETVKNGR